jgi:hypothetical protein
MTDCTLNVIIGHKRAFTNMRGEDVCACGEKLRRSQGDRDGSTYNPDLDRRPLNEQAQRVWNAMSDGEWHTLAEIAEATGDPEASVSARFRDFRKVKFGSHAVPKQRIGRQWMYRLIPNE